MPLELNVTVAAGSGYASPMVGPVDHTVHLKIDISTLTEAEVDVDGYLKPGVVFDSTGTPVGAGQFVYGIVVEPTKLPVTVPVTDALLAAQTLDCFVAVASHGIVNRDIAEDNMGRAYTADELAGFLLAACHLRLTST